MDRFVQDYLNGKYVDAKGIWHVIPSAIMLMNETCDQEEKKEIWQKYIREERRTFDEWLDHMHIDACTKDRIRMSEHANRAALVATDALVAVYNELVRNDLLTPHIALEIAKAGITILDATRA